MAGDRVMVLGHDRDTNEARALGVGAGGIQPPPYDDVFGSSDVGVVVERELYAPPPAQQFVLKLGILSADSNQAFIVTCGAWQQTFYIGGSQAGGDTVAVPFPNGGLILQREPVTVTTTQAAAWSISFCGDQVPYP